jgi:hypothetical protein
MMIIHSQNSIMKPMHLESYNRWSLWLGWGKQEILTEFWWGKSLKNAYLEDEKEIKGG